MPHQLGVSASPHAAQLPFAQVLIVQPHACPAASSPPPVVQASVVVVEVVPVSPVESVAVDSASVVVDAAPVVDSVLESSEVAAPGVQARVAPARRRATRRGWSL